MQESLDKVARYPYHPITATTAESFTFYENPAKTTVKGGTKTFRCPSQLQQRMPVSLRNLTNVTAGESLRPHPSLPSLTRSQT